MVKVAESFSFICFILFDHSLLSCRFLIFIRGSKRITKYDYMKIFWWLFNMWGKSLTMGIDKLLVNIKYKLIVILGGCKKKVII